MIRVDMSVAQPNVLTQYIAKLKKDERTEGEGVYLWQNNTGSEYRDSVRNFLYARQAGRCAYCERRLDLEPARVRIEHFHPRSSNLSPSWVRSCGERTGLAAAKWKMREIHPSNLLLSCKGEGVSQGQSCDPAKGESHICGIIFCPNEARRQNLYVVTNLGEFHAICDQVDSQDQVQDVIDNVLNLNDPFLVEARRTVLNARKREIAELYRRFPNNAGAFHRLAADRLRGDAVTGEFSSCLASLAEYHEKLASRLPS